MTPSDLNNRTQARDLAKNFIRDAAEMQKEMFEAMDENDIRASARAVATDFLNDFKFNVLEEIRKVQFNFTATKVITIETTLEI